MTDISTLTGDELRALAVQISNRLTQLERDAAAADSAVAADTAADLPRLREALDGPIATLLGDNTTTGSIRSWIAPITNNQTLTGAEGKALARLLIDVTRQVRLVARQTLRVAAQTVGDYTAANLPDEPAA